MGLVNISSVEEMEELLNALVNTENKVVGSSIDLKVEEEHIRFKREDLIKMLQLSSSIINLKSNQYVPKSITIVYEETGYKMIANNDLEYLEYKFSVLNLEHRLYDSICLPIELIKSISSVLDNEILIYKKDGSYYIRLLLEGDLYLELPQPEAALLRKPTTGYKPIFFTKGFMGDTNLVSGRYLGEAIKALMPIVEDEPVLDRRRITFIEDRAYFASRKYFMEYNLPLPKMRISLRFAEVIKKITTACGDEMTLEFYKDNSNESRIIIEGGNNILFTSTVTKVPDEGKLLDYLNRVREHKQLIIDKRDLERVVNIAYSLPYSKKEIKIRFNKDLVLSIPMKTKVTEFKIPFKEIGKVPSSKEITLSARDLKRLLDSFTSGEIILSILDTCVILNKKNLVGVLEV